MGTREIEVEMEAEARGEPATGAAALDAAPETPAQPADLAAAVAALQREGASGPLVAGQVERKLSECSATSLGLSKLLDWLRTEPQADIRVALTHSLAALLAAASRSKFSSGDSAGFEAPDAFVECGLSPEDALAIPPVPLDRLRGYTFMSWLSLDPQPESGPRAQRVLFRLLSSDGAGVEAILLEPEHPCSSDQQQQQQQRQQQRQPSRPRVSFFSRTPSGGSLVQADPAVPDGALHVTLMLRARSKGDRAWQHVQGALGLPQRGRWAQVVVTHSQPYLAAAAAAVYVDGVKRLELPLAYPALEEHATKNSVAQGLGGRIAAPTLFEGALSPQQVRELWLGEPRIKTAVPWHGGAGSGRGTAAAAPAPAASAAADANKRFAVARVGHVTPEGLAELQSNLQEALLLAPPGPAGGLAKRTLAAPNGLLQGASRALAASPPPLPSPELQREKVQRLEELSRLDLSPRDDDDDDDGNDDDDDDDGTDGNDGSVDGEVRKGEGEGEGERQRAAALKAVRWARHSGAARQREDPAVVFAYDPRTAIGGEESRSGWRIRVMGGVLETHKLCGKRRGGNVIEPQASAEAGGALEGVAFGMPSRGASVYARLCGDAAAVFDQHRHASLEGCGGMAPLLVQLAQLLPWHVRQACHIYPFSTPANLSMHGDLEALRGLLAATLLAIGEALRSRELYRADMRRLGGFGLVGWVLQRVPPECLSVAVASACMEAVLRLGYADVALRCEGMLLVLFDYRIWARAPQETQAFWIARMLALVAENTAELRLVVGVQSVLDMLAVCRKGSTPATATTKENEDEDEDEDTLRISRPPNIITVEALGADGDPNTPGSDQADGAAAAEEEAAAVAAAAAAAAREEAEANVPLHQDWLSEVCVQPLLKMVRAFFFTRAIVSVASPDAAGSPSGASGNDGSSGGNNGGGTGTGVGGGDAGAAAEDEDDEQPPARMALAAKAGPTTGEVAAIVTFCSRHPREECSVELLEMLGGMLLPLTVAKADWAADAPEQAQALYDALQGAGGIDLLLGLGSREVETRVHHQSKRKGNNQHGSQGGFNLLSRLSGGPSRSDAASPTTPLESFKLKQPPSPTSPTLGGRQELNGLLSPASGVSPRCRAAALLLVGRLILLEQRQELGSMLRELQGKVEQQEAAIEADQVRRQKQFGIVLRSLMPVPHVASFRMTERAALRVGRDAHALVLDALVATVLGGAVAREEIDDFEPHDDGLRLALPDALPVLGGLLGALSHADEGTKAIAAREILLKLSMVLKASHAAREQVTSLPRWQTWLIPVMLLHDNSLDQNDDESADYLLGEVATDLLCTLLEHETQRPDDPLAVAKKLNRAQQGWASWQGLAEATMRITKERERSRVADQLAGAKDDRRFLIPELNALVEVRATEKSARVLRQTLERVWERLAAQHAGGGLHGDAVHNLRMTLAMAEETLIAPLNALRLQPLSPGGVIASSSAKPFRCLHPSAGSSSGSIGVAVPPAAAMADASAAASGSGSGSSGVGAGVGGDRASVSSGTSGGGNGGGGGGGIGGGSSSHGTLVCGARCAIDGHHDTKWVDVALDTDGGGQSQLLGFPQSSQSWLSYCYPAYEFDEAATNRPAAAGTRHRVVFYIVRSAFDMAELDPSGWTLFGRTRNEDTGALSGWAVLDRRTEVRFASRYHPVRCWVQQTGLYHEYKIVFDPPQRRGKVLRSLDGTKVYAKLHVGEVQLMECDVEHWPRDHFQHGVALHAEADTARQALEAHGGELLRFLRSALRAVSFVRVAKQALEGKQKRRSSRRSAKEDEETEATGQVRDMAKRAKARLLGHVARHAALLPEAVVSEACALMRGMLAESLSAPSQGNRTLALVLLDCLHHGLCSLHGDNEELAPRKVDGLFSVANAALQLVQLVPNGVLDELLRSVDALLQGWRAALAAAVDDAVQRELEAEALHRHVAFRVERSSSTAMARRANPVEVAAYGAGRSQRPVGLPRAAKKALLAQQHREDERLYTAQVSRLTLQESLERRWRGLLQKDEVLQLERRQLVLAAPKLLQHRRNLFKLAPFVDPKLRVRSTLRRNPGGDPHIGASSGIADRVQRKLRKEAEQQRRHAQVNDEVGQQDQDQDQDQDQEGHHKVVNQQQDQQQEEEDPLQVAGQQVEEGACDDGAQVGGHMEHVEQDGDEQQGPLLGVHKEQEQQPESGGDEQEVKQQRQQQQQQQPALEGQQEQPTNWESIGAQLSKQISIADMSLMTQEAVAASSDATADAVAATDASGGAGAADAAGDDEPSASSAESKDDDDERQRSAAAAAATTTTTTTTMGLAFDKGSRNDGGLFVVTQTPSALKSSGTGAGTTSSGTTTKDPSPAASPVSPHLMPESIESRRKLTLAEWVNRQPDPIRGETKEPWPAAGEAVLAAARCYLIRPEVEIVGRLIVSQDAIYFDPDQPEASDLYIMRPLGYSSARTAHEAQFESINSERWQQELSEAEMDAQMAATGRHSAWERKRRRRLVWRMHDVEKVLLRRYRMRDSALELFVHSKNHKSFLLDFEPQIGCSLVQQEGSDEPTVRETELRSCRWVRDHLVGKVWQQLPATARRRSQRSGDSVRGLVQRYTRLWQERALSNFEYLMRLNSLAGRSTSDLTQYPVFPWVLADYTSEELDLESEASFRDLSKPMGALTEDRLLEARERYRSFDDPSTPKFHYGSHYSTMAGVVLYYLVRLEPFTSLHIKMQDGHLDIPDRLFNSVPGTWHMCTTAMSEVKELTPEFYHLPDFLVNHNHFELGTSQSGKPCNDVELPPWARGSPGRFVRLMREALESDHVSRRLHLWVDLIFGHKARLPDAVQADNVFYYLTYPGAVDMDAIKDPAMRLATELQIKHFGQCPLQLFSRPHPPRGPPPPPPRPLGALLRPSPAGPLLASGQATALLSEDHGPVLAVRLLDGLAAVIFESGELCSYIWGAAASSVPASTSANAAAAVASEDEHLQPDDDANAADPVAASAPAPAPAPAPALATTPGTATMSAAATTTITTATPPLALLPSPEAVAQQLEEELLRQQQQHGQVVDRSVDADAMQGAPMQHLPLSSVRRRLKWSGAGGQQQQQLPAPVRERLARGVLAWSRDAKLVAHAGQAVGAMDVCFVDTDSGHLRTWRATVHAHLADLSALAVDGASLISACEEGVVRVWDLLDADSSPNGKEWGVASSPRLSLAGHCSPVVALDVSEAQGLVVSASREAVALHSLAEGTLLGMLHEAEAVELARISPTSGRVVLVTAAPSLSLNERSLAVEAARTGLDARVTDLMLSRADPGRGAAELLVLARVDGVVEVMAMGEDLQTVARFSAWPDQPGKRIECIALCESEQALLVGSSDGVLGLMPMPTLVLTGPNATVLPVGTMDVNAKFTSAKNAVLAKIDRTRVIATARGVASEAVGVASKLAKGFQSVFGGGSGSGKAKR